MATKHHALRPLLHRDPATGYVDGAVIAECDKPNARLAVDPLKRPFVELFRVGSLEIARDVETGAIVPMSSVCRRCIAGRERRAGGRR